MAALTLAVQASDSRQDPATPGRRKGLIPARLAIYYGYPSLINGVGGDVKRAAGELSCYDSVILGDGLEFNDTDPARRPPGPGLDEHRRTAEIIKLLEQTPRRTAVYGYVDLGNSQQLSLAEVQRRARLWKGMGVRGVFLDEAGYDFGVTRDRQNAIVADLHALGLEAFLNAYDPDDLFGNGPTPLNASGGGNPKGAPHRLGLRDLFLLESFQVRDGAFEDARLWASRTAKAVEYRARFGSRVHAVTTTARADDFEESRFDYAWWSAVLWNVDGFGWGEPLFSSRNNTLSCRAPKGEEVLKRVGPFTSPVTATPTGYVRETSDGTLTIDTRSRSVRYVSR